MDTIFHMLSENHTLNVFATFQEMTLANCGCSFFMNENKCHDLKS